MDKCQHNLKENSQTHSVYCEKLEQWVSSKLCGICRFHEKAIMHQQKHSIDDYNYNYNITASTGGNGGNNSLLLSKFFIASSER